MKKYCIYGFIFVCITGTLNHFLFELSKNNIAVGIFCPVNESPWEHMKLIFYPFLIYTVFLYIKLKNSKFNIISASYAATVSAMLITLNYFYFFNGTIGGNNEWVNISSFFVGAAGGFVILYFALNSTFARGTLNGICAGMFIASAIVFTLFTFEPPLIDLFKDPQNYTYGINTLK